MVLCGAFDRSHDCLAGIVQPAYVSLCSRVGWLSAALVELEEELLNLLAACIGETPVLANNLEPAFFQDP
jgi:hypothetical protein